jgi:hypothetical protein
MCRDFDKSKIYTMECINNNMIYVGSTTITLSDTLYNYEKKFYKNKLNSSCKFIFENCVGTHPIIKLLYNFPCESQKDLNIEKEKVIDNLLNNNKYKIVNFKNNNNEEYKYKCKYCKCTINQMHKLNHDISLNHLINYHLHQ